MSSPLRPQFFCARPNGSLIPLVAIDELPAHIVIRGISRQLAPNETCGMTSLGTIEPRSQFYIVDGVQLAPIGNSAVALTGPGIHEHDQQQSTLAKVPFPGSVHHNASQNWKMSTSQFPGNGAWTSRNPSPEANGAKRNNRHEAVSRNPNKVYCSYWIRHGECDYQQQGCLYKHEMPTDPAIMERLGLRDIPKWYRDKSGLSSCLGQSRHSTRPQLTADAQWPAKGQNGQGPVGAQLTQYLAPIDYGLTECRFASPAPIAFAQEQVANGRVQQSIHQPVGVRSFDGKHAFTNNKAELSFESMAGYPSVSASPDGFIVSPAEGTFPIRASQSFNTNSAENGDLAANLHQYASGPVSKSFEDVGYPNTPHDDVFSGRPRKGLKSRRLYETRPSHFSPNKGHLSQKVKPIEKPNNGNTSSNNASPNSKESTNGPKAGQNNARLNREGTGYGSLRAANSSPSDDEIMMSARARMKEDGATDHQNGHIAGASKAGPASVKNDLFKFPRAA